MIVFLSLLILASAFDKNTLKTSLQSPRGQMQLFHSWMKAEHKTYTPREEKERFKLFSKNLEEIVKINNAQESYEVDTNFMAAMTEEEKIQMTGINNTAIPADIIDNSPPMTYSNMPAAGSKDWRKEGKVNSVQNQGRCGSAFAFSGVAALEGHYAIQTGKLLKFSEQELVDCYQNGDGCGDEQSYIDAFDRLIKKQHLALGSDYRYVAKAGNCRADSTTNAMTAAKITKTIRSTGDDKIVQGLQVGPVAVTVSVGNSFFGYRRGVLSIKECKGSGNHALVATGYTAEYFELKNEWGTRWGMGGYIRFDRKINNMCGVSTYVAYPELQKTVEEE